MANKSITYQLIIAIAGVLLFIPFLGQVHLFDWDEINFAECAREMLVSGNYFSVQINYQPFWEKPPLFIWMQALSMNVFGVNEFAARLPNAICGIITLMVLFSIGTQLYNKTFGTLWVLSYAGAFLPHFYFKSGIIDPWFNLFIFLSLYYFISFIYYNQRSKLILSALFIGLAVLTKGPAALLIFGLCVSIYWMSNGFKTILPFPQLLLFSLMVTVVGSLWFLMLIISGHTSVIEEFFEYQIRLFNTQDSGHGGPFFYHWIVLLIGCFPASVLAIRGFKKNEEDLPSHQHFKRWMIILFWVVLLLFSIVKTKIVHYSSLCYLPLSFLSAYALYYILKGKIEWKKYSNFLIIIIALIIGIALILPPFIDKNKTAIIDSGIIKDVFALENLKAEVFWSGYEWILGAFFIITTVIFIILINKKKYTLGLIGLFSVSLITINSASLIIVPRIEQYSQGAAIEFYEHLQDEDCYVTTLRFKSYAHLFYSKKHPQSNLNSYNTDWLLNGEVDKPTYFVCKINRIENILKDYPQLKEIYRKNGFVFLKR